MNVRAVTDVLDLSHDWLRALISFNLRPAVHIHPSRLPVWAADVSSLPPNVVAALSQEILTTYSLTDDCDWGLPDTGVRFFMIDPTARDQIALVLGVAAHRKQFRKVVLKNQLAALRDVLGQAKDALWLPVSEAVDSSNEVLKIDWSGLDGATLQKQLIEHGYQQLLKLLDRSKSAYWKRAVLGTPSGFSWKPCAPMNQLDCQRLIDRIIVELLPRWAPRWTWLF